MNDNDPGTLARDPRTGTPCGAVKKAALDIAGTLNEALGVICKKAAIGRESFLRGFNEGAGKDKTAAAVVRIKTPEEQFQPVLRELKAICDISGLTKAVNEMNAISLDRSQDPVTAGLISKIANLSPAEQETLSRVFLNRLSMSPAFSGAMNASKDGVSGLGTEDRKEIEAAFIRCAADALEDVGFAREDCEHLLMLSEDIFKPLDELVQFYLKPRTTLQKVRRIWKIQRLFFRTVKLIKKANTFVRSQADRPCAVLVDGAAPRQLPGAGPAAS